MLKIIATKSIIFSYIKEKALFIRIFKPIIAFLIAITVS